MADTFLQTSLTNTETQIRAYEAAIEALVVQGVASSTLDTGQTTQTVTKLNLSGLQKSLDALYNRRATMLARCNGAGTIQSRPAW